MKHVDEVGSMVREFYWILILKGLLLIIIGFLIALYPPLLSVLVAIGLVIIGILLWVLAYKVHKLWQKLPNFMK